MALFFLAVSKRFRVGPAALRLMKASMTSPQVRRAASGSVLLRYAMPIW